MILRPHSLCLPLLAAAGMAGAQSNHSQLFFDSSGTDQGAYAGNEIITISGNITYFGRRDPQPGGPGASLDFVQPASDVYVLPAGWWPGGQAEGLPLEDVSNAPNTILGAGGGGFFEEPIATTYPQGSLVSGDYDVVFDEHQDGALQSQLDFYLGRPGSPAFSVRVPADAPSLPGSGIAAMKLKATRQYEATVPLQAAWVGIQNIMEPQARLLEVATKVGEGTAQPGDFALNYAEILEGPVIAFYAAFIHLRNQLLPQFKQADDFMAMPFSAASAAIENKMKRAVGLAADPPDADFARAVALAAQRPPTGTNMDPLARAMAAAGAVTDEEQRLAAGLLAALEKYQGADAAGDPRWCLAHARTAKHLASLLEAQTGRTSPVLTALRQQLAAYPVNLDSVASVVSGRQAVVRTQGWPPAVEQMLAGLGASGADMAAGREAFGAMDFSFSRTRSLAALDAALAEAGGSAGYADLATSLDATIATLLAEPSLDKGDPLVSLATTFTGTARTPLPLTATGSDPLGRSIVFDWDLDGDGAFGDALGAEVSKAWPAAFTGHIGVRVINAAGRTAHAWTHVTITDANRPPVMAGITPGSAFLASDTGAELAFHAEAVDPDGQLVSIQWLLNGDPVAVGSNYAFTPTTAQAGVHALVAKATDGQGGETTHVWLLAIKKPGVALADLSMTMEAPETPLQTGAEFTWTMTVENRGPSAAENVVVTQSLPDGLSFVRVSSSFGTASGGGQTVLANLGTLAAGGLATVWVQTTAAAAGSYPAGVSVRADAADPVPGNNNASARVRVNAPSPQSVDVSLAAAVAPSPATVGGTQTITFTTANEGSHTATGLVLETQLPESVDFISSSPPALSSQAGLIRIAVPDVTDAASTVVTVVVRPTLAGGGPAHAQVFASQHDPLPSNNRTEVELSAVFVPLPVSDLAVTQAPPVAPRAGLPATWTITVTNNGPDAAQRVSLNDVLPAGAAFTGATPAPASLANGRASFSLGTLANGASRSISLTVEPHAAGEASNRVTAASASQDVNGAESVSVVDVLPAPATTADLSVTITASVSSGLLGTGIDFSVTVRNDGPDAASGVTTRVQLPEGISFVSATGGASHEDGNLSLSLTSLAGGADAAFTFVAVPGIATPLSVVATVASDDLDPDAADNRALVRLQGLDPLASVAIIRNLDDPEISVLQGYLTEMGLTSQIFDDETVNSASLLAYRLVIWNDLSYAAFGVRPPLIELLQGVADAGKPLYFIGDDLAYVINFALGEPHASIWESLIHLKRTGSNLGAGGMTIVNASHPATGGIYGVVGNSSYLWDPDDTTATGQPGETVLGRSASSDSVVAFRDPVTRRKSLTQNELVSTSVANAEGREERKKLFKNGVAWLLSEDTPVDLALTQSARSSVTLGDAVKITLTAVNRGPGTASVVTLRQTLPDGLVFGSASSSRGLVTHDAGVVTAELGLLAADESVTVEVLLSAQAAGTAVSAANVASGEPEALPADNSSSLAITVRPGGPVELKATYRFDDTLAACEPDTPPLLAIDPANADDFATVDVNGRTRRVYRWDGSPDPASSQAGLKLNTAGLLPQDNYTVEMLFRFTETNSQHRSIIHTGNRIGDHSLYVSPSDAIMVYPLSNGSSAFVTGTFHHLALTVAPDGIVTTWLDGQLQRSETTTSLNISVENLLHFFVDNDQGPAQTEYVDGEIALLRVYEGVLPANRIAAQAAYPFGPDEPMDVNMQMTAARNPIGVWTAGFSAERGTPFLQSPIVADGDARWYSWSGTGNGPHIYRSRVDSTISHLTIRQPPDLLGMDPSFDGRNAVVRWTAPAAGTYRIQGRWQGIDVSPNGTDVALLKNGSTETTLFADTVVGFEQRKSFEVTVSLATGETVDFSLGRGGNSNLYDSTGLDAVVTPLVLRDDCADGTDLALLHAPPGKVVVPGEAFTVELTAANAGLSPAPDVILTSPVPVGWTFVSAAGGTAALAEGAVNVALGLLGPGETRDVSLVFVANAAGTYTHTAKVTGGNFDPAPWNNWSDSDVAIGAVIPLSATVRATVNQIAAGGEATFELVMANAGTVAAPGAVLRAALPAGTVFVSATGGGVLENGTVVFPPRTVAAGEAAGYSLRLRANLPGALTVSAVAASGDPAVRESTGSAMLTVNPAAFPPPRLEVAVTTDPPQIYAGCRVTILYKVTNASPSAASDVELSGFIPETLVIISATTSQGTATVTAGRLSAALGTVKTGAPVTVSVQALATAAEATALPASVRGGAFSAPGLKHLWEFDEPAGPVSSSTVLTDRLGGAHGAVRGAGAVATGTGVQLPGGNANSAPYIDLPNGLISPLRQVTFEGWLTVNALDSNWGHFFSFGSSQPGGAAGEVFGPGNTNGGGEEGLDFISLTSSIGTNYQSQRLAVRNGDPDGAGEFLHDSNSPTVTGQPIHIAVTVDNTTSGQMTVRYYRDGLDKGGLVNLPFNLSDLNDVNNWLGRGNWTLYPNMPATFDEFRLHERVLTAGEIATSRLAGPNAFTADATAGPGGLAGFSTTATALIRRDIEVPPVGSPCAMPVALSLFAAPEQQSYRLAWIATPGWKYLIQSSPDLLRWINVPTLLTATQTLENWIDPGPPSTEINPMLDPTRFYRVLELAD